MGFRMFETLQEKIFGLIFIVALVTSVTTIFYSSDRTKYQLDAAVILLGAAVVTLMLTPFLMLSSPIIEVLSHYILEGYQIAVNKQYIFGFSAQQYEVFCNDYGAFCDNDSVFHQLDILALAACIIAGLRITLSIGLALRGRPSSLEHVKAMERSGKGPLGYAVGGIIIPIAGFWLVSYPEAYKSALIVKKLLEHHPTVMLIIVAVVFVFSVQFLTELILTYICFAILKARRI